MHALRLVIGILAIPFAVGGIVMAVLAVVALLNARWLTTLVLVILACGGIGIAGGFFIAWRWLAPAAIERRRGASTG
jgi:hypothetical protein